MLTVILFVSFVCLFYEREIVLLMVEILKIILYYYNGFFSRVIMPAVYIFEYRLKFSEVNGQFYTTGHCSKHLNPTKFKSISHGLT